MKKYIVIAVAIMLVGVPLAGAQFDVFAPDQGGTGYGSTTADNIGKALIVSSTDPFLYTFGDAGGGSGTVGPGTSTQIAVFNTSSSITSFAGLTFDSTTTRLGIGTETPSAGLQISANESSTHGTGAAFAITNTATGGNSWMFRVGANGMYTPAGGISLGDNDSYALFITTSSPRRFSFGASGATQYPSSTIHVFDNSGTTASTSIQVTTLGSAALILQGDSANTGGEPGDAYISMTTDNGTHGAYMFQAQRLVGDGTTYDPFNTGGFLSNASVFGSRFDDPVQIAQSSTPVMTIDTSGNTGWGITSSISALLHSKSGASIVPMIIEGTDTSTSTRGGNLTNTRTNFLRIFNNDAVSTGTFAGIQFGQGAYSTSRLHAGIWIQPNQITSNGTSDLYLGTKGAVAQTQIVPRMVITGGAVDGIAAGRVGIGTPVPSSTLHVVGTGFFSQALVASSTLQVTGATTLDSTLQVSTTLTSLDGRFLSSVASATNNVAYRIGASNFASLATSPLPQNQYLIRAYGGTNPPADPQNDHFYVRADGFTKFNGGLFGGPITAASYPIAGNAFQRTHGGVLTTFGNYTGFLLQENMQPDTGSDVNNSYFGSQMYLVNNGGSLASQSGNVGALYAEANSSDDMTLASLSGIQVKTYPQRTTAGSGNTWTNEQGILISRWSVGGSHAITNYAGLRIEPLNQYTGTSTITNAHAIWIEDQNSGANPSTVVRTNNQSLYIASQGMGSATKGNIEMAGGDWNTGHIQVGTGHMYYTSASSSLRFSTTAPTATTYAMAIETSGASSTLKIGQPGGQSCLVMQSASGTIGTAVYVYFDNTAVMYSTTTKPSFCK